MQLGLIPHLLRLSCTKLSVNYLSLMKNKKVLCLFDVDGTLTESRKIITDDVLSFLKNNVAPKSDIALVGGSDYCKISEQMRLNVEGSGLFHSIFSENGLVVHRNGNEHFRESIQKYIGEEKLQRFINFALRYMSELILPVKRGTFVEFRSSMINLCPVGRSCSQSERDEFEIYDRQHNVRVKFVEALRKEFPDLGLTFAIGGQISIDAFPNGWDKTYCLRHIPEDEFETIHFFGDRTDPGGNDHELFIHERVVGHKVTDSKDTMVQLSKVLGL